ncbi:MAG: tetratricopeptide repeat protein [Deltaproteobacteria bacterium]|nr:tetratricopeptide repeat protein [Deltaproteobacteria bacterium]
MLAIMALLVRFLAHVPAGTVWSIFGLSTLLAVIVFFGTTEALNRGLLPRGRPIRPRRFGLDGEDAADVDETARERLVDDYIETARSLIQSERHQDAADLLSKALESEPGSSRLLNYLGICYSRMSRFEEAVRSYESAIEHDYDHAGAHFNLAVALENAEQVAKAIEQYRRYLNVGGITGEPDELLGRARERLAFLERMYPHKD